jgi:hypothetical protein
VAKVVAAAEVRVPAAAVSVNPTVPLTGWPSSDMILNRTAQWPFAVSGRKAVVRVEPRLTGEPESTRLPSGAVTVNDVKPPAGGS